MNKHIFFKDLGTLPYAEAFEIQQKLMDELIAEKLSNRKREENGEEKLPTDNYFLFVEHPHVYTLGKSGKPAHLLITEEKLKEIQAEFHQSNRGGDITYHGFGQIIGYPVLDLDNFKSDIHLYMRNLEEVIIRVIAAYGLVGMRSEGETGVWLDVGTPRVRKICAMGVKTSKWVTMHGFALNVNTDLDYFGYIIPCGIRDKGVTSLKEELGKEFSAEEISEIKESILFHFAEVFGAEFMPKEDVF